MSDFDVLNFNSKELEILNELKRKNGLTTMSLIRLALRVYQKVDIAQKSGYTMKFVNDKGEEFESLKGHLATKYLDQYE